MAGTHIWRRRAAAMALVVLAGIPVAACGGKGNTNTPSTGATTNPGDAGVGGGSGDGAGVTPSATTGSGPTKGTGGGGGGAPTYPKDARTYAQAAIKAWMARDYTRLGQLATAAAVQQVKDSVTYGGLPSNSWHFISCEGAAGSSYCTFINDNGDVTHVRLANPVLGAPQAVNELPLERTEYPHNAASYVGAFLNAWQNGNRYRMLAYANPDVVGHFAGTPLQATTLFCDGAAGSTYVQVNEGGNASVPRFVLRVGNEKAAAGGKHAISEYLAADPANSPANC